MAAGIYRINGPKNGVYFGSTVSFRKRLEKHRRDLRNNKHHSPFMQAHYNTYGLDAFTFTIVDIIDNPNQIEENGKTALINAEQDYLDWVFRYVSADERYNNVRNAGNTLGIKLSTEHKSKISAKSKGNKYSLGYKHSPETIAKKIQAVAKTYTLLSPEGELVTIKNLKAFCIEHNITYQNMNAVAKGRQKSAYGWRKA